MRIRETVKAVSELPTELRQLAKDIQRAVFAVLTLAIVILAVGLSAIAGAVRHAN